MERTECKSSQGSACETSTTVRSLVHYTLATFFVVIVIVVIVIVVVAASTNGPGQIAAKECQIFR
jgi:hypothetical protein